MGQIICHKMFNSFLLVKVGMKGFYLDSFEKLKETETGEYLIIIILLLAVKSKSMKL